MIRLTASAVAQLRQILGHHPEKGAGLRLGVARGGCAGLQYVMKVQSPEPGDGIIGDPGAQVFLDPNAASYLSGCTLDYVDDLADAGFRIFNPNAARSCGCGTSFEPVPEAAGNEPIPEGEPCATPA